MSPTIPEKMKAVQLVGYKQRYEIHEVPVPKIGPNDVLVRVGAAGFCHTDYQVWEGVYKSPTPITPSHEPVGTIVAVGDEAQSKWKIGQRVGIILFRHACNHCVGCQTFHDVRHCERKDMAGLSADGGMADYIIGDADDTVLLPDSVPFEQAAPLMCAGGTVWGGIQSAAVAPGDTIGIIGIGGLGTLGVQFAKALGYRVVAIDNRQEGRDLATEFPLKADLVVDSNDEDAADKIKKWSGKGGLAGVVVCTDRNPVITWGLTLLRPTGTYVPLGLPTDPLQFDSFVLVFERLKIVGSLVASKVETEEMLKVVDKFGVRSHLTTVPLDKVPDLPDMYMDPHLKGRLVMKVES